MDTLDLQEYGTIKITTRNGRASGHIESVNKYFSFSYSDNLKELKPLVIEELLMRLRETHPCKK